MGYIFFPRQMMLVSGFMNDENQSLLAEDPTLAAILLWKDWGPLFMNLLASVIYHGKKDASGAGGFLFYPLRKSKEQD